MGHITNSLQQASENGHIPVKVALGIGEKADSLLDRSAKLLNILKKHVGTDLGGDILALVGEITKVRTNVYYHDKEPDGQ